MLEFWTPSTGCSFRSSSQGCFGSLLAHNRCYSRINILELHLWNINHTFTFLNYSQNPSRMIDLVYKKRYATGRVEKEMDELDFSRHISTVAFSCAPHVWCLIGAEPEESDRKGTVPLSCRKTAFFHTPGGRLCPADVRKQIIHGYT